MTAAITYRKTRQGEWVAFGPVTAFPAWTEKTTVALVTVTKKDGTLKTEYVERYGKSFQADGVECRYGYLRKDDASPARRTRTYGYDFAEYAGGFDRDGN